MKFRNRLGFTFLLLTIHGSHPGYSQEGDLQWEFKTEGPIYSSPSIGLDSTLYVISSDLNLYAIHPDGSEKWRFFMNQYSRAPVIGSDGTVYMGATSGEHFIYALNPDGSEKWKCRMNERSIVSAHGEDGTVYAIASDQNVCAIDSEGVLKWSFITSSYINTGITIGLDGTIYFGDYDETVYALNTDGSEKWKIKFPHYAGIQSSISIGKDGTLFCNGMYHTVAINPDGTEKWSLYFDYDFSRSTPTIGMDGTLYFGSNDTYLYAVSPDGHIKWKYRTDGKITSSPAIGSDNTVYVGSNDKFLYAVNPDGSEKWKFRTNGEIGSSPAVGLNGSVYVGSSDKSLYALNSSSKGLAQSVWPRLGNNNQNNFNGANPNCPRAVIDSPTLHLSKAEPGHLDARASFDPKGQALTYRWRCIEKPVPSCFNLFDSTQSVTEVLFTGDCFGYYKFSITVENQEGLKSSAIIRISYQPYQYWCYQTQGSVSSSPALDSEGTVFFGSDDGHLYAVKHDGTLLWKYKTGKSISFAPAIGPDGTIYFGEGVRSNLLNAINPDGTLKWSYKTFGFIYSKAAIGPDSTIYVGGGSELYAIHPTGLTKWIFYTGSNISSLISIGIDGTVFVGSMDGFFYAIQPDGTLKWKYRIDSDDLGSAIDTDGTIYLATGSRLFSLHPDGSENWGIYAHDQFFSSPIIGSDGTVYIMSRATINLPALHDEGQLLAVNPDGTKKWALDIRAFDVNTTVIPSPTQGSDGMIYFGSGDSCFYAIDGDGTQKLKMQTNGPVHTSPALDDSGNVYFGSSDGNLYVLKTASRGLAQSAWPKYGRNNKNDGNGFNPHCPIAKVYSKNITATPKDTLSLDGSLSFDPDGDTLTYRWRCIEKPTGAKVTILDSTSAVTEVKIHNAIFGQFIFSLTVQDESSLQSSTNIFLDYAQSELWKFDIHNEITASPAIGMDGTIYIGSWDTYLYAVNPDGTQKWKFQTGDRITSSAAIGTDSTIYFGSMDSCFYALNMNGTEKWKFKANGRIGSTPAIDTDNTIYFGSYDDFLYAVNPDGSLKWKYKANGLRGGIDSNPVIGFDGTIYVVVGASCSGCKEQLFAISGKGDLKWIFTASGNIEASPAIAGDGTLYLGSAGSWFYAIKPDGSLKWAVESLYCSFNSAVIGEDGTVYVGTDSHYLYAFRSDGVLEWQYRTNDDIASAPLVGSDGKIYFGSYDMNYYALNEDGTENWKFKTNGRNCSSSAISDKGILYFGSLDGNLYAVQTSSMGLARSTWPKAGYNNRNTGNLSFANTGDDTDDEKLPQEILLMQNYPNPFNPITTINYQLSKKSYCEICIYNARGELVERIVRGIEGKGMHSVTWDASKAGSGVYFYRVTAGAKNKTNKMLRLK
jgi:outer membrane protein assembly factor BamB